MNAVQNASFASPLASAQYGLVEPSPLESFVAGISGIGGWTIAFTVLALLVAYDQGKHGCRVTYARVLTVLIASYIRQKGSIVGPTFKLPFIGPFLESMDPKFEEYKAKWASGELSCVSVFHKYGALHSP